MRDWSTPSDSSHAKTCGDASSSVCFCHSMGVLPGPRGALREYRSRSWPAGTGRRCARNFACRAAAEARTAGVDDARTLPVVLLLLLLDTGAARDSRKDPRICAGDDDCLACVGICGEP